MTVGASVAGRLICAHLFVVDGDTVRCDGERLRLLGDGRPYVSGIDTPEIRRARCPAERRLGVAARRRLEALVAGGVKVMSSGRRDRYGRLLVRIVLPDGRAAGAVLLAEGLARRWQPGYRGDWCG